MTTQGDLVTLDSNQQVTRIAAPTDGIYTINWASKVWTWLKRGMTTLGDIEYMGGGSTPTRLAAPGDGTYSIAFASSIPSYVAVLPNVIPPGIITMYGATAAPSGYLNCDGSAVSRGTFAALFSIIGTTFGAGNGTTTFNLPDLRTRFPLGYQQFVHNLNETGGNFDHTHDMANHTHQGGSHTHTFTTSTTSLNHDHDLNNITNASLAIGTGADHVVQDGPTNNTDVSHNHTGPTDAGGVVATDTPSTNTTGSANPPYIVVNFIIKT
jgi:microcystin-dependent protein